jgi:hypothetical protein
MHLDPTQYARDAGPHAHGRARGPQGCLDRATCPGSPYGGEAMQYEFRTRAILGTTVKIESQETELEVFDSGGVRVVIKLPNQRRY